MKRIDTATKQVDKFGAGKHGFTNGNVIGGVPATDLTDSWFDNLQEEAANVVEAAGIVLDGNVRTQLLQALRSGALTYGTDTGAANACVLTYSPAIPALVDGMVLWFKAKANNTGAATLNVDGLGVKPIVGGAHAALQGGEIIANGRCLVIWNATLNAFVLIECTGAALQVAPATQSGQALQLGQKGYVRMTASGSFVVPPGVFLMYLDATAPGGGGGGGGGGGTGTAVGGGGGAGGVGQNVVRLALVVVPNQTITVTMGAKGTGGALSGAAGNAGSTAGNVTITNVNGGTLTLAGGGAGAGGANATGSTSGGAPGNPGYPIGQYGQDATNGSASASGGMGGSSPFGGGGGGGRGAAIPGANSPGNNASGYGAGGGGGGGVYGGSAGFTNGLKGGDGGDPFAFFQW